MKWMKNAWRYLVDNNILESIRFTLFDASHRDVMRFLRTKK